MLPLNDMKKPKRPKKRSRKKHIKHTKTFHVIEGLFFLGLILFFIVTGSFLLWASSLKTPDIESFEQRKVAQSTKIYDRTGEILLFDVHENVKRTLIPFENISRHVKNASVAIEDAEFYEHNGIKPLAFLRAVIANLQAREFAQGGSTITQQVVKNSVLTSEKKVSRKLKEWVLAVKLEKSLTKEQILELYLNESPYGGSIYGVEEASRTFFSKSASDVTLAEAAYLAALPQAPTFYSPYGTNKESLDKRKNLVLAKMLENKFITEEEYEEAKIEEVEFGARAPIGIRAPHFVMYVREYLARKYGERALEERGFKVITTLDFELQQKAEEIVNRYALENSEKFDATNAGLIAIDSETGQILTMVGSRNYFDEEIDGNFNITLAHRQPGSAFKPFVYATALGKGYPPETVVFDVQTQFSTTCEKDKFISDDNCYSPVNYDSVFRGPITMREALAQSVNIPAIKFLYLSGLRDSLQTAKALGINSLTDIGVYGLTLVLGGGEVSLLDITSAYTVFANEGIRNEAQAVLRIEDSGGNIVEEFRQSPNRVLDKQVALSISDILSDNEARTPAFGSRSFLHFPGRDVAVKTGTTNDYRDAWIIGYTPKIAVGAWAGNNDNSPMDKKVAGFIIAPLWNEFMYRAFDKIKDEKFEHPKIENKTSLKPVLKGVWEGGIPYYIDTVSGKLATENTPVELREEKFVTDIHSILHWVIKNNPRGNKPPSPEKDFQYESWEYAVDQWEIENGYTQSTSSSSTAQIPTEFDDVHKPEFAPSVSVSNFDSNKLYSRNDLISVPVVVNKTEFPIGRVDYFINGEFLETKKQSPFTLSFNPQNIGATKPSNTLKIVAYDFVLNKKEVTITFKVQ